MNVVPARSVTSLVVILNYSKLSYSEHVFSLTSLTPILQIVFETCHPCPRWWSKTCSGGWGCWRSSRSLQSRGTAEMTMSGKVFFEETSLKKKSKIFYEVKTWAEGAVDVVWRFSGCAVEANRLGLTCNQNRLEIDFRFFPSFHNFNELQSIGAEDHLKPLKTLPRSAWPAAIHLCQGYQQSTCIRWFSNFHFPSNWNLINGVSPRRQ